MSRPVKGWPFPGNWKALVLVVLLWGIPAGFLFGSLLADTVLKFFFSHVVPILF